MTTARTRDMVAATNSLLDVLLNVYTQEFPATEKSTLGKMRTHVLRWEQLTNRTPPAAIDRPALLQFRLACLAAGLAASTINSHLRTITGLAKLVGNNATCNRLSLPESDSPKPTPRLTDLDRLWLQTPGTSWPHTHRLNARPVWCRIDPALWWRALLMLGFSTGLRRADLFSLRWEQIETDRIPTRNRKTKKQQFIPLAEPLRPWLELLRTNHTPTVLGPTDRCHQIDRECQRLATLANVPDFGLQALRRASARAYERAHAGTGRLILNHGTTVTDRHYLDVEDTLRDAAAKLTFPPEFLGKPSLERQLTLF